jgi:perosamine synthetase
MTSQNTFHDSEPFTCKRSDNVFAAIEKCLDNGLGACFIVGEDRSLVGRVTLDDIRSGILDGHVLDDTSLERYIDRGNGNGAKNGGPPRNEPAIGEGPLTPVVDYRGCLIDVAVDRTKQFVQVAKPNLSHHEFRTMLDAFISSWISSKGPYVGQLETEFAAYIGARHGAAVTNGTVALHLALLALGIGENDDVIVPDLTFAATINVVLACGATPIIADIDPHTWTLTREQVERVMTPRTRAIIPVHLYGRPAEMEPIVELARERGCFVVEDCAEAHGARYAGRTVGQFGDVSCFSFYANKIVTTGEGGICVTSSPQLNDAIRQLRDHGVTPGTSYWHERVGYNYRMTNLQAAIGCSQLWRIDEALERNQRIQSMYRNRLADIRGVTFPPTLPSIYEPVVWLACVLVPAEARARLIEQARRADIEMRPFFYPLSALPAYERYARPCPNSAALSRTGINLPTSSAVDEKVADKIRGIFLEALDQR